MDQNRQISDVNLSERKKQILKAIIEAHIELGEPVGSKYLTSVDVISCSSATIRNEMAELEEMGYLEQPHTSSGRVPSELGYRLYVDSLVEKYRLTEAEIGELNRTLRGKQAELDSILERAVKLASRFTKYTALTIKPRQRRISVSRFDVIPIDTYTMVLVMIIGRVAKTKYIRSDMEVTADAAARLSIVLNTYVANLTSMEISMPIVMEMERAMGEYEYLVSPVVKSVCELLSSFDGGELRFDGINRLLSYPDYYDTDRLRDMLEMFERGDDLLQVLSDDTCAEDANGKMKIYIGRENRVKIMDNSTLIYKPVMRDGVAVGAIGIIGPTRMNYGRAMSLIDKISSGVSEIITSGDDAIRDKYLLNGETHD